MTERGENALSQTPLQFTVGPSSLSWERDTLVIDVDEVAVPFPSRLRGQIRFTPSALQHDHFTLDQNAHHHWWPYAPFGRLSASFSSPNLRWEGHGYADANAGTAALEADFSGWTWSRATVPDGAVMIYEPQERSGRSKTIAIHVDGTGHASTYDPPPIVSLKSGLWGIKRTTRSESADQTAITTPFLDAPFYTRDAISMVLDGKVCPAVHEALNLDRFASNWVKCLLPFRMPRRFRWSP